jgi:hypothetical protein
MTAFRVAITRVLLPREGRAKYLVTLCTDVGERQWATMMPVSDDTARHNTMTRLGITEPQPGPIQSLLNEGHDPTWEGP